MIQIYEIKIGAFCLQETILK